MAEQAKVASQHTSRSLSYSIQAISLLIGATHIWGVLPLSIPRSRLSQLSYHIPSNPSTMHPNPASHTHDPVTSPKAHLGVSDTLGEHLDTRHNT